jgi:hypothetical protein
MASIKIKTTPTLLTPAVDINNTPSGPLSSLYQNEYAVGNYFYPTDIGTSSQRLHVIQFTATVPQTSYYAGGNASQPDPTTLLEGAANFVTNPASTPVLSQTLSSTSDVISLYMPDGIAMSYDAGYDSVNITDYKAMQIYEMLKTLDNAPEWDWAHMGDSISKMVGSNQNVLKEAGALGLNAIFGNVLPINAAAQATGIAFNPQLQVIFKGVDTRKFVFQFVFTPKSAEEAGKVKDIVQAFRFHAAPEYADTDASGNAGVGLYFVPPSIFEIRYLYQGNDNPYMTRIKQCVLQTVNVEYGASGGTWATFVDGAPIQTKISLNFQEINIITKNDINQGY